MPVHNELSGPVRSFVALHCLLSVLVICLAFQPVRSDSDTLCRHGPSNCSCDLTEDGFYNLSCAGLGFRGFPSIAAPLATKVVYLNLRNNDITNLPADCLSNFTSLQTFNLQVNFVSTLPYGIFHDLENLSNLLLSGNKWICNSDLIWLRDWLADQRTNADVSIDYDDIICKGPDHLTNQSLIEVNFVEHLMSCVTTNDQSQLVLYYTWDSRDRYNNELCVMFCLDEGYTYAALYGANTCICGRISDGTSTEDCDDACTNDDNTCTMIVVEGAFYVYNVTVNVNAYNNIHEAVKVEVTFIGTSTQCIWETGDGQVFTRPLSIVYKYGAPGNYTIRATVEFNGENRTGVTEMQVLLPVTGHLSCPLVLPTLTVPLVELTLVEGNQITAKWTLPDHVPYVTVEDTPALILGSKSFDYYPDFSSIDPITTRRSSPTQTLVIFPTQYFRHDAILSAWEFVSAGSDAEIHLHLQVFRPTCDGNQLPIPPDCCESCPSVFVCVNDDVSLETPCDTSLPVNPSLPQYQLISETIIASPSSPTTLHQVLPNTEIKVNKYDVIGFQQNGAIIDCLSEAATDNTYFADTHRWLAVGEHVLDPLQVQNASTCLFRVLYTQPQVVTPPVLALVPAGFYSFQVDLSNLVTEPTSLSCNVTLEAAIKDFQLVNPTADVLRSGEVPLLVKVSAGTNLLLNWTIAPASDNTAYVGQVKFLTQCPDELLSICSELTGSGKSVAVIDFVFQPCDTYMVNLIAYNSVDQKVLNQTLEVVEEDLQLTLSSDAGEIYKNCEAVFSVVSTSNCSLNILWFIDGNQQHHESDHQLRYSFRTEGTHNVAVAAADVSQSLNVTVLNTSWELYFTSAPDFVLIGQDIEFSLNLISVVEKVITVIWDFGDSDKPEITNFTLTSRKIELAKNHSFYTKDIFIVNVTVQFDICNLNVLHSVRSLNETLFFKDILVPNCSRVHDSVQFQALIWSFENTPFEIYWIFGDGTNLKTSNTSVIHAYNTPGPFKVEASVTSKNIVQTKSKFTCVQEPLTGVQLENDGPTLLGQITLFTLNFTSGSNYEFYWNNDTSTQTFAPALSFNYTFPKPGHFTMDVIIHNFFNQVMISSNVSIIEPLGGLQVQHNCIQDTSGIFCPLGSNSTFSAYVQRGIPTRFQWAPDFSIAADTKNFTFSFATTGIFCINVTTFNSFSRISKHFCIEARAAIFNLSILSNSTTMATNEVARLVAAHSSGNNVQYFWRFCEACNEINASSVVFHSYEEPGIYYILLEARNVVSTVRSDINIYVADLEIQSNLERMNSAKVSQLYKFHCRLPDVEPRKVEWRFEHSSLSAETKTGTNVSYSFKNTGSYLVTLTALIGNSTLSKDISVRSLEEISGLMLYVDVSTSPVLPTHQLINFTATVESGTDIEYKWSFTNSDVFVVDTSFYLYSYRNPGSYDLLVCAENHPSFPTPVAYLPVTVIDAIYGVELLVANSTSRFVQLNETVTVSAYVSNGSNIAYTWTIEGSTYTDSSFEYCFLEAGSYVIELLLSNQINSINESKVIVVLERPKNLQWITSNWTFPVGSEVVLEASIESGSDVEFSWIVANKTNTVYNFTEDSMMHKTLLSIMITTPGNYTVILTATNNLGTLELVNILSLMVPISGASITCNNRVPVNVTQVYKASVTKGTGVAYQWRFAVGSPQKTSAYGDVVSYSHPISGSFLVKVEARNKISSDVASTNVSAVEAINNVQLIADAEYILLNRSFTVTVTFEGGTEADVRYTWNLDDGLGDFNSTSPVQDVTYSKQGIHIISVTCEDGISRASTFLNISVINCILPELQALPSTPEAVYRSQSMLLEYNIVEVLCTSLWTVYNWTVYRTASCNALLPEPIDLPTSIETSRPSLVIPMNTLEYGSHCFQLSVSFAGIPIANTARSVINVTETPLVAVIDGGNRRIASSKEFLVLDGSQSIDPDLVGDQKTGLLYKWECISYSSEVSDGLVGVDAMPIPSLRCIQGRSTDNKITAKLDSSKRYVFILTVTKGKRQSITNQTVEVVDGSVPAVQISCISCTSSKIISGSQRLELIGACSNCGDSTYAMKWTAVRDDGTRIQLNKVSTTTGDSLNSLVIRAGTLSVGRLYTFRLTVDGGDFDEPGLAEVTYTIGMPPIGGSCSVTPSESVAMETLVTISCKDWFDPDAQSASFLYIMQIMDLGESNGGVGSTLLYHGSRDTYETYLPLGGNQGKEPLELVVRVQDDQGAESEPISFSLHVRKPELKGVTTVEWMHTYSQPQLMSLQQASDPQRLLDYATTMASVLNEEPQATNEIEERVNIRDDIINAVATCPCLGVNDLSHISTTFAIATALPDEIVYENTYTTILSSMDILLSTLAASTGEGVNIDDITSNAILMIISNTMSALNQEDSKLVTSSLDPDFKMAAVAELLSDTELLLDSLMAAQIVHEESLRLTSETIIVSATKTHPREISTNLEESGTYFRVPQTLFLDLPVKEEILEELFLYSQNPYTWSSLTSSNITTKVSQLEYKHVNGTKISVKNLDQDEMIVIGLPQTDSYSAQEVNHELKSGETTYITMDYGRDVSLLPSYVEVVLSTSSWITADGFISVLIGLEEEPTLETCLSSVNFTFFGNSATASTIHTFLVKPGSSIPVTAHHITAVNRYDFTANISVSMFQQSCQYYDVQLETWSESGCQTLADSTRQVATCACDHLTSFGAGSQVVPSDIRFRDLKNLDIKANPVALIVCCAILFLYTIAMGLAWYYDRLDLKFISVVPICGKNGAYCYEIYINTGERIGAGTSAHIGISLYGSNGKTGSRHLLSKHAFKRNTRAAFRIYSECNLEDVQKVRVWHDNTGLDPSWYLATILVVDLQTGRRFHFVCETWLSLVEVEGAVEKTFYVLGQDELKKFSTIFQCETKRQLANRHLWLSVIDRPQQSRFTRRQRVTCCLVLIYTYMCVNAVWYGLLSDAGDGSLLLVALTTGLIVFPFNFLVALAFIRTKYKFVPNAYSNMPRSAETVEVDALCQMSQNSDSFLSAGSFASHTTTEADSGAFDLKHETDVFEMKVMTRKSDRHKDVDSSKPLEGATLRPLNEQGRWWSAESILGWPEQLPPYNKSENIELKKLSDDTEEQMLSGVVDKKHMLPGVGDKKHMLPGVVDKKQMLSGVVKKKHMLPGVGDKKHMLPGVIIVEPVGGDKKTTEPKKELCRGKSMRRGIKTLKKSSNMLRTHSLDDLTASDDEFWQSLLEEEGVSKETTQTAKEYLKRKKSRPIEECCEKASRNELVAPTSHVAFCPRASASLVRDKSRIISSDEGIGHGASDSTCTLPGNASNDQSAASGQPHANDDQSEASSQPSASDDQSASSGQPVLRSKTKRQTSTCTSAKTYLLPSWFVYINYVMCFAIVVLCGIVVLLYGSEFGQEVAVKWIITLFVSLTISMLLLEPVKVLLFALYSASAYESLDSCYSNDDNVVDSPIYEHQELANCARIIRPPQGFGLLQAKEEGRKLGMMHAMLRQLWVFVTLLVLVMVISYASRNQAGIDTVSVLKDVYVNAVFGEERKTFNEIQMFEDFWSWAMEVFARQSHASDFDDIDHYGDILGVARLRQIRSVKEQCQVEQSNKYNDYFDEVCYGSGTSYSEDRGIFTSSNLNWTYKSSEELNGMSVSGQIGDYSGGGFVQDLGSTYNSTLDILEDLIQCRWLDQQTRVVFVEATFYNANIKLYTVLHLLVEFPLSSGAIPSPVIISTSLDRYSQATSLLVFEILFALLLIYFAYIKITDLLHCGIKQFITSVWSMLSVAMVMLGFSVVCLLVVQAVCSDRALDAYADDPAIFVNFYRAAFYSELLMDCYGLLVFIGTVKMIQVLRFSRWLVFFLTVLSSCCWLLIGAAVLFILLVVGFSFLGNQLFGAVMSDFRSVCSSILYLYSFVPGASSRSLTPLLDLFPTGGAMFMSAYFYFCLVIVTCLFAAVVINVYRCAGKGRVKPSFDFDDRAMIEFMIERFKKQLGIIKPKEFRHRVKFTGVDSISTRSLSSGGTFSQTSASQVSSAGSGSGISLLIPGEKINPDYMMSLLNRLTPMVDDVLEKLESLKLFEVDEEYIGSELLCRKNMSKGSKCLKKIHAVRNKENTSGSLESSKRTSLQDLYKETATAKERYRRRSDPARSAKKVQVAVRPKSEEHEKNIYNTNCMVNREKLRDCKTESLCKPAWGRNQSS